MAEEAELWCRKHQSQVPPRVAHLEAVNSPAVAVGTAREAQPVRRVSRTSSFGQAGSFWL